MTTHRASDFYTEGEISRMGLRPASRPVFTIAQVLRRPSWVMFALEAANGGG